MKEEDYTPEQAQAEMIELLTKAGRRCAYDLKHAADYMTGDVEFQKIMRDRADHFLSVFNPGNDQKNYRTRLHGIILNLENEVAKLKEVCRKYNISPFEYEDLPF